MLEVKKHPRELTLVVLSVFLIISSAVTVLFLKKELPDISEESAIYSNLGFYFMINLNIVVIMLLSFFVFRNIIKLLLDRKKNILGTKLRTKLMVSFVGLSLVPTVLLFFVAKGIFDNILEGWFSPQIVSTVDSSMAIAKFYYKETEKELISDIKAIDSEITPSFNRSLSKKLLSIKLDKLRKNYNLNEIALVKYKQGVFQYLSHSKSTNLILPPFDRSLFEKEVKFENIVQPEEALEKDFIRIYRQIPGSKKGTFELLIATKLVPSQLGNLLTSVVDSFDEYQELHSYKRPLASSYLLTLVMVMLLIIVTAMWVSFYLARSMTVPIQKLAEGTEEISLGNLDYQITEVGDDELGFLVSSFNSMTSDLKKTTNELVRAQKLAAWQEVAQRVAHEIKNPLTPIQLAAQRVQKRFNKDDVLSSVSINDSDLLNKSCSVIVEQVEVIRKMVNEFSRFVRMPEVQLESLDLNLIIKNTIDVYKESHIDIDFLESYDVSLPKIMLDKEQITRVLNNLIDNSIAAIRENAFDDCKNLSKVANQYSGSHKSKMSNSILIKTSLNEAKHSICLSISDSGPGLKDDLKTRVFDPYYTTKKEGTGLGLPIVNTIVADHGGYIKIEDSELGGAKFVIELTLS